MGRNSQLLTKFIYNLKNVHLVQSKRSPGSGRTVREESSYIASHLGINTDIFFHKFAVCILH